MVGGESEIILDCYRLAHWYHVNPEVFLAMPLSEVSMHLDRTATLDREQRSVGDDE
jgi:hypothetical protein